MNKSKKEEKFLDSELSFDLISNYINLEYKSPKSSEEAIEKFELLNAYVEKNNYYLRDDVLIELIRENDIFFEMINLIINDYKNQIVLGKYENIFANELLIRTIKVYNKYKKSSNSELDYDSNFEIKDSVDIYLREIRKIPILSENEEKNLARRIAQGDQEARKEFIERNLRLVVSIAKKYIGRGLTLPDLIQAGNTGLITAVDKYDLGKNTRFSTYAYYWIKNALQKELATNRNIRFPLYQYKNLIHYYEAVRDLEVELGRTPKIEEIAKRLEISPKNAAKLQRLQKDTLSLNFIINADGNELGDFISDSQPQRETILVDQDKQFELKELINKIFEDSNFTPIELEIIIQRLMCNNKITLEEIAEKINISKERVRALEARVIYKIITHSNSRKLVDYAEYPAAASSNRKKALDFYLRDRNNKYKLPPANKIKKKKLNNQD